MGFFINLLHLPLAEQISNLHGVLATLTPLVFGAIFVMVIVARKFQLGGLYKPTLWLLGIQSFLLAAASTAGVVAYVAYRTAGGAREFLLSASQTSWLHSIVFEYKEYLCAVAPWLLLVIAFFVVAKLGPEFYKNKTALQLILAFTILSAAFAMISATLAVLVSKMAPLEKFNVGQDLFSRGGNIAIVGAILTLAIIGGLFWFISSRSRQDKKLNSSSLASMMYGSAAGLTVMWIIDVVKEGIAPFKTWLTFVPGIGPYSGVVFFSLVTVVVVTLIVWLATLKSSKQLSLKAAGWVIITSALVQALFLFPPFYHIFLPS